MATPRIVAVFKGAAPPATDDEQSACLMQLVRKRIQRASFGFDVDVVVVSPSTEVTPDTLRPHDVVIIGYADTFMEYEPPGPLRVDWKLDRPNYLATKALVAEAYGAIPFTVFPFSTNDAATFNWYGFPPGHHDREDEPWIAVRAALNAAQERLSA